MLEELIGRTAVITGAGNGIGLALARRLVLEGMAVVLVDRDAAALDAAVASIRARDGGADVVAEVIDVADRDAVQAVADRAFDRFGAVHLLCNNAGISSRGRVWEFTPANWATILGVNLGGVVNAIGAFVPRMLGQVEGHIVNTASLAAFVTYGNSTPYATTKKAVLGLSEGLWHELRSEGSAIGVSVLVPRRVETAIRAHSREAGMPFVLRDAADAGAIGEAMPPEDVADVVLDAVRRGTFYAITHRTDEWLGALRSYFDGVLDGREPSSVRPKVTARTQEGA